MGTSRNLEVAGCAEGGNVVGRDRREMVFLLPSGSRAWDQCRATLRRSYEGRSATVARGGQDELDLACNLQVLAKAGPRLRHPRPCGTCGEEASETSCSGPQVAAALRNLANRYPQAPAAPPASRLPPVTTPATPPDPSLPSASPLRTWLWPS